MQINLSNAQKRDAVVEAQSTSRRETVRWCDDTGAQAMHRKILRATMPCDIDDMMAQNDEDLHAVAEALVKGDPEIDVESYGRFLSETMRVYITSKGGIAYRVNMEEIVYGADGEEKERRPRTQADSNVNAEIPLAWTGKRMPKAKVFNRFFFRNTLQVVHTSGLTYDFLYEMASDLAAKDEMMLLGGGEKGTDRLVFRRNTPAYTGFLEGRVQGDKYALLLHLTNMELKVPEPDEGGDK